MFYSFWSYRFSTGSCLNFGTVTNCISIDETPLVGEVVAVDINIDMTGVTSPDKLAGSYPGTLNWDPAVLRGLYKLYRAPPTGFTGVANTEDTGSDINF
ncbi:MAG: hypothetical protein IPF54_13185 [Draconibacterium sp.]|nr:hypothetical protein [Draconibacterium sp.]